MQLEVAFDEDGIREKTSVKESEERRKAKEKAGQAAHAAHQNVRITCHALQPFIAQ